MAEVVYELKVVLNNDGSVNVWQENPGDASPLEIIGLLDKLKLEILLGMRVAPEKVDDERSIHSTQRPQGNEA